MTAVQMTAVAETTAKGSRSSSNSQESDGAKDLFESLVKNQGKNAGTAKSEKQGEGEQDAGEVSEKEERSSKASSGAKGRIGFERMLAGTGEGSNASSSEETATGGEGTTSADGEGAAMAGLVSAATALRAGEAAKQTGKTDLPGSQSPTATPQSADELIDAKLPPQDAPRADAAARFGRNAMPSGGEEGQKLGRADFVSMRTDFEPVSVREAFAALGSPGSAVAAMRKRAELGTTLGAMRNGDVPIGGKDAATGLAAQGDGSGDLADTIARLADRASGRHAHATRIAEARADGPTIQSTGDGKGMIERKIDASEPFGRQIGAVIAGEMGQARLPDAPNLTGSSGSPAGSNAPSGENMRMRAGGAALKTLEIQLQPAHFGKLEVVMRVVDGQMAIQLSVTEAETMMRLEDDREGLRSVLKSAGFDVDDASISITLRDQGAPQRQVAASDGAQMGARLGQDAGAGAGAGGRPGGDGRQPRDGTGAASLQHHEGAGESRPAELERGQRSSNSGLYL
ncbi:MAG: flagellar hook-length control protein FliK [Fulvimarina manganoxydans]|uniref:flagellar hook-length control protein FliK n=1 Tax=Fulvimarina manganoxydans TaxID=937218 RepID=UPI002353BD9F|nr:flagellar hook-length control protein FliK [Fulvimarina manganoxydans]MCK5932805.1 flagellar hook-length control protein FliK [Fulvimarina manganoxydans]